LIVFAFAGDSTITSDLLIAILDSVLMYPIQPGHSSHSIHEVGHLTQRSALSCLLVVHSMQLRRHGRIPEPLLGFPAVLPPHTWL